MRQLAVLLSAAVALLAARTASAAPIDFSGEDTARLAGIGSMTFGVAIVHAGEIDWQWVGGPPDGFNRRPFHTFAVSETDVIGRYTMIPPGGGSITSSPGAGGRDSRLIIPFTPGVPQGGAGDVPSVLQNVIDEAMNGVTPDPRGRGIGTGSSIAITDAAQGFLTTLATTPFTESPIVNIDPPTGGGGEGGGPGGGNPMVPTPEPASLTLFGTGLLLVVQRVRRALRH